MTSLYPQSLLILCHLDSCSNEITFVDINLIISINRHLFYLERTATSFAVRRTRFIFGVTLDDGDVLSNLRRRKDENCDDVVFAFV